MDATVEQVTNDAPTAEVDISPPPPARRLPDAVRTSVEAVKAAQLAARERQRRETRQARLVVGGLVAALVVGWVAVRSHLQAGRTARAAAAVTAPAPATLPASEVAAAAPAAPEPEAPAPAKAATPDPAAEEACRDNYQSKRWRTASGACAAAFAGRPDDAKLALRVAESEYARDHLSEARDWAQRTLALDAKEANALAVVALSEQRSGHSEAAARAFRSYLAVAPRGWLAAEARSTLRGDRQHARRAGAAARDGADGTATATAATAPAPFLSPTPDR
jgi:hypothetical protein